MAAVAQRILLWHWGRRGGGPRYTLEVARAMAARGDVAVYLSTSRQAEVAGEFAALGLPGLPVDTYTGALEAALAMLRLPALRRRFARFLQEERIDTVICTMGHLWNVAVAPVVRAAGARYVLTVHDAVLHPGEENALRSWCLTRELTATDGLVMLTNHVRDRFLAQHAYPRERTWVLPHGVFAFGPAQARPAPAGRSFRLLYFGRILPYKGFDLLLDAYALLRQRLGDGVTLTIAGSGDVRPHAALLAGLGGIELHNRWIAEDEIPSFLARADAVVLPYREASQSGVIPAAYGAGLPAVATPVGGLTEQLIDGQTGRLAAALTAEAVAEAVADLAGDPVLYERASAGALRYAHEMLSWDAVAAGLVDIAARLGPRRTAGPQ